MKRVLLENGVIKVHPAIVKVELLVFGKDFFFTRFVFSWVVINQTESDTLVRFENRKFFIEKS